MKIAIPFLALALAAGSASAAEANSAKGAKDRTERKTITLINAEGKVDGSSEISRESVRECIVSLPGQDALEAEVVPDSRFLREINGEAGKNAWTKVYSAKITVNYMVYKKDLLIVATQSVEGKEPTLREVEKRLPQTRTFESNPADGGTFAGRSNRQYYFTSAEDVVKDVKARAQVWLRQQAPLLCGDVR